MNERLSVVPAIGLFFFSGATSYWVSVDGFTRGSLRVAGLQASDPGRRPPLLWASPHVVRRNVPTLVAVMVLMVMLSSAGKWLSSIRSLNGTVDQRLDAVGLTDLVVVVSVGRFH